MTSNYFSKEVKESMEKRKYDQPDAETMPVEEIKKLQSEKLVEQVQHVYAHVPYYKKLMDEIGRAHV